jgi:uncharacterized YigZ family protein
VQDTFKTIESASTGQYKDRGSKFLAYAFPVRNETEIDKFRGELRKKHFDARHHVYAFMLGSEGKTYRASDDGEPANSSGQPILGQIRSFELTDILIVVVRYFGGTKLGVPGLINAYKTAAHDALSNAKIITKTVTSALVLEFEYPLMNVVMRIAKELSIEQGESEFGMNCKIIFNVPKSRVDEAISKYSVIHGLKISK